MPIVYECDDCPVKRVGVVEDSQVNEPEGWLVASGYFLELAGGGSGQRVLCPKCVKARGIDNPPWKWNGPSLADKDKLKGRKQSKGTTGKPPEFRSMKSVAKIKKANVNERPDEGYTVDDNSGL